MFFQNDEITTGQLNNKTEIKIHLTTNKLLYFHNEIGHVIDLGKGADNNIYEKLKKVSEKYGLKLPDEKILSLPQNQTMLFHEYAIAAKRILELFRMNLEGNFTLVHLWPDHFDFSIEWFTGNKDEQIGTGISPGDELYPEPYLYVNPYPFNENVTKIKLPLGVWHTHPWKGIKVEWKVLKKIPSPAAAADKVLELFQIAKKNFELSY